MDEIDDNSRRTWKHSEILALLQCCNERKNEFQLSRRKKFAYQNILKDLISRGVLKSETTYLTIANKIKSLLRAYKIAKKNEEETGFNSSFFPYINQIEEIFGNKPMISNIYSLNLCETPSIDSHENEENEEEEISLNKYSIKEDKDLIISNVHSLNLSGAPTEALYDKIENEEDTIPLKKYTGKKLVQSKSKLTAESSSSSKCRTKKKRTKFSKKMYFKEKLKLEKIVVKEKIEYWKRKEENAQKRHEEIMNFIRNFLNENN